MVWKTLWSDSGMIQNVLDLRVPTYSILFYNIFIVLFILQIP